MKKHVIVAMFVAILSGGFILGCADTYPNTSTTTMQTTKFAGMQNECTNGGVKIEVLVDGKVDDAQTQYLCNGTQGTQEPSGANIAIQTTQFDGTQGKCTNGGVKIEVLIDNKVDDAQTQYICNGTQAQSGQYGINNTLQTAKFDDEQGGCTNGGVKIEILVDGKVDNTQTQYICNGTQGQAGTQGQGGSNTTMQTTKFDDEQGGCTNGGVKIEILVDGKVDDAQTQYICNGTQGQAGTQGQSGTNATIRTTKFDDEQGGCTNGGVKVEVLVDDKVLSEQTQYICNGVNRTTECQTDNSCRETFYCDQTTFICVNKKKFGEKCTQSNQCLGYQCVEGKCGVIGDTILFGHYEQDGDSTNGAESLEWRVLDINVDGHLLVISRVINHSNFSSSESPLLTWENCPIRSWLNGYDKSYNLAHQDYRSDNFIDKAFTAEEKAKIITSNVPAHPHPDYSISQGNDTSDKIFLLSVEEAENYFTDDEDRIGDGISSLCAKLHCYRTPWWLRTVASKPPGASKPHSSFISSNGSIDSYPVTLGNSYNYTYIGVRPAMWIDY